MHIIDGRSKQEFERGHLDNSINIDLSDIEEGKLPDLPKDSPILLYCVSGGRASRAKNILESLGFTSVINGGGYEDLKAESFDFKTLYKL